MWLSSHLSLPKCSENLKMIELLALSDLSAIHLNVLDNYMVCVLNVLKQSD